MGTYGYIKHSELSHHGIKGQRWGVRNGPPYPLSESDRSAKERKLNAARKWKPNDTSPKRVLDAYARVAAGDKVAYPGYSRTKNAVQTLAGNKRGISTNVRALAGKEERIHNARRGAATYYGTPVAQAFYGDKTTANKNISRYTTHAAGKHKGAQEVSKRVIKGYAEELTGKGKYKTITKGIEEGLENMLTVGSAGQRANSKASARAQAKKSLKNIDILVNHEKDPKRSDKAAILGLRALEGPNADLSKKNKEWFLYEDQTIGFPEVADLVNQGYNKKDILSIINTKRDEYWSNYDHSPESFGFGEGYGLEEFLDKCIEVKKSNKK